MGLVWTMVNITVRYKSVQEKVRACPLASSSLYNVLRRNHVILYIFVPLICSILFVFAAYLSFYLMEVTITSGPFEFMPVQSLIK